MPPLTGIVKHLLIINVIVFIAIRLIPQEWAMMLPFYPPSSDYFQPFQIITYMFTHFDVIHILFNMLSLYFLGPAVEYTLGPKRFLALYLISGLMGLAAHFMFYYMPFFSGEVGTAPVLGASGAVYGVVIGFAALYPDRQLMLLFPPIPIRAWLMAVILVGIGLYSGLTGTGGNIAHFAHLGGALAGFVLCRYWKAGGRFLG